MVALSAATTKGLLEEIEFSSPPDPSPTSCRGQQVTVLRDKGLDKAADAVAYCGSMAHVDGYNDCRHETVRERLFSHLRHCCSNCDKWVAGKLFKTHEDDRLPLGYSLIPIACDAEESTELSAESIRSFEKHFINLIRRLMKKKVGWGLHASTQHDGERRFIRAILAVPPGSHIGSIPSLNVGTPEPISEYKSLLAWMLFPALKIGQGVVRGLIMAAFFKGNHFRSLGILYGQGKSKKKKATPNTSPIGVGSEEGLRECPEVGSSDPGLRRTHALGDPPPRQETDSNATPEVSQAPQVQAGKVDIPATAGPLYLSQSLSPSGAALLGRDHREFCPTCRREGKLSERSYTRTAVYSEVKDLPHHLERVDFGWAELEKAAKNQLTRLVEG